MSPARMATRRRPKTGFTAVTSSLRLQLCTVNESPEDRRRHIAALLAFAPTVVRYGSRMRLRFEHGPTALWLNEILPADDVELIGITEDGGTIEVLNPQIVLGRYGFRDGRWTFGQGAAAAVCVSRGALQAAGTLNGHGLKVACPNVPMMLTLVAALSRLQITAHPTDGDPRVAVGASEVPVLLARLGIAEVAEEYRHLRKPNTMGTNQ